MIDTHINRIATRYTLEVSNKRQIYTAAAQSILSALYGSPVQAIACKTQWAEKYGRVIAMQVAVMDAMEWANVLHNTFNKEVIC